MNGLQQIFVGQALGIVLTISRVAGFVALSPIPGDYVPMTSRVGLILVVGWLASSVAVLPPGLTGLNGSTVLVASSEVALGLATGFIFRILLMASSVAGSTVAQSMGLTTASQFDPSTGTQETPVAKMATLMAMLLAIAVGAHRVALAYLLESFRVLPIGASLTIAPTMPTVLRLVTDTLAVGIRLATPVVASGIAMQITLGVISRAAPSLQLFSVGLSITLGTGFFVLMASLRDVGSGLGEHIGHLPLYLDQFFTAVGGR
jgi:flagellar biosynthetic protein FliR